MVWDHAPVASGELVKLCAEKLGWKKPTTYTVLRKLCQRGFCQNQDTIVTALVPKEQVQVYQSEHFVDRVFDGSLPQFLTAFLDGRGPEPGGGPRRSGASSTGIPASEEEWIWTSSVRLAACSSRW